MKTTKPILGVFSIVVIVAFTVSHAGEEKGYVPKEDEEIYGTWVNEEYDQTWYKGSKIIFDPDGTWVWHRTVSDTERSHSHPYIMKDKWIGPQGNVWYKISYYNRLTKLYYFNLIRISGSGKVMEYVYDDKDFPTEIDQDDLTYRILYGQ